ncbi:MAG: hypothetical protein PHW46_02315, partial [Candidatus Omnitrophica bacterium]|nr:hypothetical protein [Candidatus Omnitrophota bacterium]
VRLYAIQEITGSPEWKDLMKNFLEGIMNKMEALQEEIAPQEEASGELTSLAAFIGMNKIPTHVNERYLLLMPQEFYKNGEFNDHRTEYGERFEIGKVSTGDLREGSITEEKRVEMLRFYVNKIIEKAKGLEKRTVALVPRETPEKELQRLQDLGIRFVPTDMEELAQNLPQEKPAKRKEFQEIMYTIMLLTRAIDENTGRETAIYMFMNKYLKGLFNLENISAGEYFDAIKKGIVADIVKGYLRCRPAEILDAQAEHYQNSHALIFA